MKRIGLFWLVAYSAYWMGVFVSAVGDTPKPSSEPYGWDFPALAFLFLVVPAVIAYALGYSDGKRKGGDE